ncbi:MAG: hypothetical protein RL684_977 [Pseudomonadota bacterium]|jgi:tight adherence protein C
MSEAALHDGLGVLAGASACAALAAGLACAWVVHALPSLRAALSRWQRAAGQAPQAAAQPTGAWQRFGLCLGHWVSPCALALPVSWRARLAAQLARAGLAATWCAESWLGLQVALFVAALLGVALLARVQLLLFWPGGLLLLLLVPWQGWQHLRQGVRRRLASIERELPAWLELLSLGLEAGTAFPAALQRALARAPSGPLRDEFARLVHEVRSGKSRRDAFRHMDARLGLPSLSSVVAAIVQAEASGLSLAPVLRAQARRATQERFARAEKRAMEAPVKMLGPLVLCIFPCTFIVVGFPIAAMLLWGA